MNLGNSGKIGNDLVSGIYARRCSVEKKKPPEIDVRTDKTRL